MRREDRSTFQKKLIVRLMPFDKYTQQVMSTEGLYPRFEVNVPSVFTLKNLSDVLARRWFRNDKYDITLYQEDYTGYGWDPRTLNAATQRTRMPINNALAIFDLLCHSPSEDHIRLDYQLKPGNPSRTDHLGKRVIKTDHQPQTFAPAGKKTPLMKREDDDGFSWNDNLENTNGLSIFGNYRGENSMLSAMYVPQANPMDAEASMNQMETEKNKKFKMGKPGQASLAVDPPQGSKTEVRSVFGRVDEESNLGIRVVDLQGMRDPPYNQLREDSMKLEASPPASLNTSPIKAGYSPMPIEKPAVVVPPKAGKFEKGVELVKNFLAAKNDKEKNSTGGGTSIHSNSGQFVNR